MDAWNIWPVLALGLSRTTSSEDTVLFYFTLNSGPVQNRRPSSLPELGLFLSVFLLGFKT